MRAKDMNDTQTKAEFRHGWHKLLLVTLRTIIMCILINYIHTFFGLHAPQKATLHFLMEEEGGHEP